MISKSFLALSFLVAAFSLVPAKVNAAGTQALELASSFVDGAVLQRGMNVPVWGWAEPGAKVLVEFANQGRSAITDDKGKWLDRACPKKAFFRNSP